MLKTTLKMALIPMLAISLTIGCSKKNDSAALRRGGPAVQPNGVPGNTVVTTGPAGRPGQTVPATADTSSAPYVAMIRDIVVSMHGQGAQSDVAMIEKFYYYRDTSCATLVAGKGYSWGSFTTSQPNGSQLSTGIGIFGVNQDGVPWKDFAAIEQGSFASPVLYFGDFGTVGQDGFPAAIDHSVKFMKMGSPNSIDQNNVGNWSFIGTWESDCTLF